MEEGRRHHRVPVEVRRRVDVRRLAPVARGLEPGERLLEQRPLVVARRVLLPPEHVLLRVVVHLTVLVHVEDATSNMECPLRQRVSQLLESPRPVIAVVAELHIGILGRVEDAPVGIRQHFHDPVHNTLRDFLEEWNPERRVAVEVGVQQLRVVVRHLLEVRHDPALVHRVAVEPAAHMIANPAPRHRGEGLLYHFAHPVLAGVVPAGEQESDPRGVRKLRSGPEAAIPDIEQPCHVGGRPVEDGGRDGAALRLVERLGDVASDRLGAFGDLVALLPIKARHLPQHRDEPGPPVGIVFGWEVRPAKEHFALGREERRERPASLARQGLHGALVARVHIRTLVPVDLDADEVPVQQLGDRGVVIGLPVHHVAPMAPHGTDIEQDRLVLVAGARERPVAPGVPMHRLVGGGLQVGGGFGREEIRHRRKANPGLAPGVRAGAQLPCSRYRTAVLDKSSAPITRLPSSISNVGL